MYSVKLCEPLERTRFVKTSYMLHPLRLNKVPDILEPSLWGCAYVQAETPCRQQVARELEGPIRQAVSRTIYEGILRYYSYTYHIAGGF